MKINRMFEIIYLLMSRERMTVQELADHFEVSSRTIHRDIDSLMQAGVPLYTSRGACGGVSLIDGFILDKALLSEDEQMQILLGLRGFSHREVVSENELQEKLSLLFGQTPTDWIEVDFSRWGYGEKDDKRFEALKTAILNQRSILIRYVNSQAETSEREIYPLKLVYRSKAWYLQAYCLDKLDYRTFRITRIISIDEGQTRFDRDQYSVPALESPDKKNYDLVRIELIFQPQLASRVYDEFDVDAIEVSDTGELYVHTTYPDTDYLYTLLASFGDAVIIVEPKKLREKVRVKARKALNDI